LVQLTLKFKRECFVAYGFVVCEGQLMAPFYLPSLTKNYNISNFLVDT
jgi:hypothetical protein